MHPNEVFEINPQIKWFKNCVFFFCLDTKDTKKSRTKDFSTPGNPASLLFILHARFHKDVFCEKNEIIYFY